jgi:phage major head subunit gpT-like protein
VRVHIVLDAGEAQAYLDFLAIMSDRQVVRYANLYAWLAEIRGWTEFVWCRDRTLEEMEKRGLYVTPPRHDSAPR